MRIVKLCVVFGLCLLLAGCASTASYKSSPKEQAKTIQDLNAQISSLKAEVDGLTEANKRLAQERDHLEGKLAEIMGKTPAKELVK